MSVREMTAADIDAVAELRVRAWQSAYTGLMPRPFLEAMSVEEDAARRREMFARTEGTVINLVAESPGGTVTGWAALGPNRPEGAHTRVAPGPAGDAELYAIYVLPELLGTGLGRELMGSCLERAVQQGFTRVLLWVVEGNDRARRFYERAGFAPNGAEDTYDIDGTDIPIVRYEMGLALGPGPGPGLRLGMPQPLKDSGSA